MLTWKCTLRTIHSQLTKLLHALRNSTARTSCNELFTLHWTAYTLPTQPYITPKWAVLIQCKAYLYWTEHLQPKSYTSVSRLTNKHKSEPLRLWPIELIASESVVHCISNMDYCRAPLWCKQIAMIRYNFLQCTIHVFHGIVFPKIKHPFFSNLENSFALLPVGLVYMKPKL